MLLLLLCLPAAAEETPEGTETVIVLAVWEETPGTGTEPEESEPAGEAGPETDTEEETAPEAAPEEPCAEPEPAAEEPENEPEPAAEDPETEPEAAPEEPCPDQEPAAEEPETVPEPVPEMTAETPAEDGEDPLAETAEAGGAPYADQGPYVEARLVGEIALTQTPSGTYTAQFTVERFDAATGTYVSYCYTVTGFADAAAAQEYAGGLVRYGAGAPVSLADGSLIDAEKLIDYSTDSNLCWAASCSDMLILSGWAQVPEGADFSNEDVLFDYYASMFTNAAGMQNAGLLWFFEGVNFIYRIAGAAQVVGGQSAEDGLLREYCADDMVTFCDLWYTDGFGEAMTSLTGDADGDVCAIGLIIGFYDPETDTRLGGHSITVTGYATDEDGNFTQIVFADSDNSCRIGGTDRTVYPNTYTAFPVSFSDGTWTMNDYAGLEFSTRLDSVCLLKYYSDSVAEKKEEGGTMDAVRDPDVAVTNVTLLNGKNRSVDTVRAGETLSARVSVENHGAAVYTADVPVTYILYKDGEECARVEGTSGDMYLRAATTASFTQPLIGQQNVLEPGEYSLVCVVDPDRTVTEAYYNNNTSKQVLTFTVKPAKTHRHAAGLMIVPENSGVYASPGMAGYKVFVYNAPAAVQAVIYHADTVDIGTGSARTVLTEEACRIVPGGSGSYTLEFSEAFLDTLPEGACTFELSIGGATYYFTVTVSR